MESGEYSKLEKDFLGNERMVHYDANGKMTGASEVIRDADGSFRVGVPISADHISAPSSTPSSVGHLGTSQHQATVDLPKVSSDPTNPLQDDMANKNSSHKSFSNGNIATYGIVAFIGTALLTLLVATMMRGRGSESTGTGVAVPQVENRIQTPSETPPNPAEDPTPGQDAPIFEDRRPDDPTEHRGERNNPLRDNQEEPRPDGITVPETQTDPRASDVPRQDLPRRKKEDPPKKNDPQKENGDPVDLRGDEGEPAPPPKDDSAGDNTSNIR
jgi:hypothetical protein